MSLVEPRRGPNPLYRPAALLRTIWRRTFSFRRKKVKLDDRFAGYKGVRDITIKKGPTGLGIMIIEGRHTEAGRGIFVSDLQEGSAAEQAGLNIGDMILAVNRESLLSCTYDSAAAKLKQTEGVVILTVCSPNLKDGETPDDPSRPKTPQPAASPAKPEPPADPATAVPQPNRDTVLEINTNNEVLGISLVGGSDTLISGAVAIILEIYKEGAIAKDGRLKVGDQIKDCNGVQITKEMSNERLHLVVKLKAPKVKLTVYRPEPLAFDEVETELSRKSGRPLGLNCVAPLEGPGLYLGEIMPGSPAEVDGKLQRGDFLVSIDGKDVSGLEPVAAAAILKLAGNKVPIKVKRYKPIR